MIKVLLEAPILTNSGYGEHARLVYRALKECKEVDLLVNPLNWGQTSWSWEMNRERSEIDRDIEKFSDSLEIHRLANEPFHCDLHVLVGLPNEFVKKAPYAVCITAGIETDRVHPKWLEKTTSQIDKIIVPSEHAKFGFNNTSYKMMNPHSKDTYILDCSCPVSVIPYPVKDVKNKKINLNLKTDFNFLSVAMLGPRKNLENTIKWFIEEFREEENVGLILKTGSASNSIIDFEKTENYIKNIIESTVGTYKCSIYLVHGDMSEEQMHSLYSLEKVKCLVSTSHGEGFGLPIFEAAYNQLPVVATNWSGHLDFLTISDPRDNVFSKKSFFAEVDYSLAKIPDHVAWEDIIEENSQWAYPKESSFKDQIRKVYSNYGLYKKKAKKLQEHVLRHFTEDKVMNLFRKEVIEDYLHFRSTTEDTPAILEEFKAKTGFKIS